MIADMSYVVATLALTKERVIGQVIKSRYIGRTLTYTVRLQTPIKLRWRPQPVRELSFQESELEVLDLKTYFKQPYDGQYGMN
jgi:hypothetical protein